MPEQPYTLGRQASIALTFHVSFVSADYAVKSIKWSNTETVRLHVSHSLALVHVGIWSVLSCACVIMGNRMRRTGLEGCVSPFS